MTLISKGSLPDIDLHDLQARLSDVSDRISALRTTLGSTPDLSDRLSDLKGSLTALPDLSDRLSDLRGTLGALPDRLGDLPDALSELPDRIGSLPDRLRDVAGPAAGRGGPRRGRSSRARRLAVPLLVAGALVGVFFVARGRRPTAARHDPMEPDSAAPLREASSLSH